MDKKDGLISYATDTGLRPYQEDRFVVCSDGEHTGIKCLMAVMDGHGGSEVSEFLSASLLEYFLTKGEGSLRETIRSLSDQTSSMHAGSTLSVVVIPKADETTAYVAVIGDSPVIIRDKEGRIIMSPEHNVRSNTQEREAAITRGAIYEQGYIWDPSGGHGLQMSRALGDSALSEILNKEPEMYEVELGPESFIIIGSDG
ncbi:MAG: protein serine/threonine phosphatase 2C family protein, partial [Thaumarchaeota archaeon]|nr:protein serine/threonine phosphatase 2C family protein [Nitrososphaerota archaeon]